MSWTFRRLQTCTLFDNFAHCLQISFTFSSFLCFCVKKSSIIFSTFWCTVHSSIGSRSRWPQSNLSAENDIYSNLSLSLINLGGVACFKLGKMGKNWISLKDYIGGELFGPFLHPCVRPIAEDIPALIISSKNVFFFFKTKSWLFSRRSWALPVQSILAMEVWIVTLLQGMIRLFGLNSISSPSAVRLRVPSPP